MNETIIREAFRKAKEDIIGLGEELSDLKSEILGLKAEFRLISSFINDFKIREIRENLIFEHSNTPTDQQTGSQTQNQASFSPNSPNFSALQHINPAETPIPTDNPTVPPEIKGLIEPKTGISTGNGGVPTDRQTNQQTLQHIPLSSANSKSVSLDNAHELLEGLDILKKEVRIKFKRLTSQEIQVFSQLYSLEEQGNVVDYKLLADYLRLSESSIRDYIGKIQKKGIPISKEKVNNKRILLHISPELKKIASLQTILKLREI